MQRWKSVKNIYSVDVLRTPASCAPAVAGSARQLTAAAHIPAPAVRVGSRGISSLLAHYISGRRVQQQDQQAVAAVQPSDPLPASLSVKLIAQSQLGVELVNFSAHSVHRYRVVLA